MKTKNFTQFSHTENGYHMHIGVRIKENGTFENKSSMKFISYKNIIEYEHQYYLNNENKI